MIGAPEMMLADASDAIRSARGPTSSRRRAGVCCCLATQRRPLDGETLPADLEPAALVMLEEKVRPDAADTLRYFPSRAWRSR